MTAVHEALPDIDTLLGDVSRYFETPHDLVVTDRLDRAEKILLLRHWEHDLQLLMVASEENMTTDLPPTTAHQLSEVKSALVALGDVSAPSGPAKVG
ncbi:hypothetical protein UAJ10_17440 [Nitrospirillum sp. BR 11164]|uniref:hypothetical protein n=1 Tax=Nitrospirillum sp. BR 11164 TaxID=3104324 RepID=UPI002AFFF33E|nr:hypothetical protein [Nitrospirillum sp. BR 11164]MEA1650794.1 hypothetical protein [Nitrospirillum sp. BR 11164]